METIFIRESRRNIDKAVICMFYDILEENGNYVLRFIVSLNSFLKMVCVAITYT